MAELVDALDSKSGSRKGVQVRFLFWALLNPVSHWFTGFFFLWCVIFSRFLPLSAAFIDTKLTHRMTHQKKVPIPAPNQHCQVHKKLKKRLTFLHSSHHFVQKPVSGNLIVAVMAVTPKTSQVFIKNYSSRFLPLLTSPVNGNQTTVYKMAALTGMVHSLNLTPSTI